MMRRQPGEEDESLKQKRSSCIRFYCYACLFCGGHLFVLVLVTGSPYLEYLFSRQKWVSRSVFTAVDADIDASGGRV
ncbi:uncharacterized protein HKW66_Vig0094210 [Vigna angularis]|uniref:Transmembrane protein n=1 Tax=Phaseolus angularis TaxID=3914 RepID=A0A8T0KS72_PHAAN|nr:uncharacterized protein HKW66_Vig0094210 [Vigna angularis]